MNECVVVFTHTLKKIYCLLILKLNASSHQKKIIASNTWKGYQTYMLN